MMEKKVGWLQKRGAVVKNWKRRWFVLCAFDHVNLVYFDRESPSASATPKGVIPLHSSIVKTNADAQTGRQHSIVICTAFSRDFYVHASSAQEIDEWIRAIVKAQQQWRKDNDFDEHILDSLSGKNSLQDRKNEAQNVEEEEEEEEEERGESNRSAKRRTTLDIKFPGIGDSSAPTTRRRTASRSTNGVALGWLGRSRGTTSSTGGAAASAADDDDHALEQLDACDRVYVEESSLLSSMRGGGGPLTVAVAKRLWADFCAVEARLRNEKMSMLRRSQAQSSRSSAGLGDDSTLGTPGNPRLFGASLIAVMRREAMARGEAVEPLPTTLASAAASNSVDILVDSAHAAVSMRPPAVIVQIMEALRRSALDVCGIFRLSASREAMRQLTARIERGESIDFMSVENHTLACLLKQWLRELADPLMTFALYNTWILVPQRYADDASKKLVMVRRLLRRLPPEHLCMLYRLIDLMLDFDQHSAQSNMNASNIAIVLAPNLFRSDASDPLLDIAHASFILNLTKLFLENFSFLFAHQFEEQQEERSDDAADSSSPGSSDSSSEAASSSATAGSGASQRANSVWLPSHNPARDAHARSKTVAAQLVQLDDYLDSIQAELLVRSNADIFLPAAGDDKVVADDGCVQRLGCIFEPMQSARSDDDGDDSVDNAKAALEADVGFIDDFIAHKLH
jgi:RhoGAP domain/PH domain